MPNVAARLDTALRDAGVPIVGVSIGQEGNRTTWKSSPASTQAAAQPTIDVFDPNAQSVVDGELDTQIRGTMDNERLISAVIWAILDTYAEFKPATVAKYQAARTKIIAAYKAQPWKP